MSTPETVSYDPSTLSLRRRMLVRLVVGVAKLLSTRSPKRIRRTLTWLRRGARPATSAEAGEARREVVAVSLVCAGREGCLPRSVAVVLLCRLRGVWPTWCIGARRMPPFGAHAWVEADGEPVGENAPPDYFRPMLTVPPA